MNIKVMGEKQAILYSGNINKKTIIISIVCPYENIVKFQQNENIIDIFRLSLNDLDVDTSGLKAPI